MKIITKSKSSESVEYIIIYGRDFDSDSLKIITDTYNNQIPEVIKTKNIEDIDFSSEPEIITDLELELKCCVTS